MIGNAPSQARGETAADLAVEFLHQDKWILMLGSDPLELEKMNGIVTTALFTRRDRNAKGGGVQGSAASKVGDDLLRYSGKAGVPVS